MAIAEHLPLPDLVRRRHPGTSPRTELEAATRLIADLAALVDGGLVVVQKQLGGPVRYGAAQRAGDTPG